MKVKLIGIFVCMLLVGTVLPVTGNVIVEKSPLSSINGNTLYVGGSGEGNYTKIQDAIDNASDGDTVFVYDDSSPYNEWIEINKVIELMGENKCNTIILDKSISISASGVTVSGFSIQGGGIYINSNSNVIYNNNFISYGYQFGWGGISISKSIYNTIYDNSFINCGLICGLITFEFENNIYNNTVNGKQLVYLYGVSNRIFEDVGQVILHSCNNITIKNSFISNLIMGIQIYESENCFISDNLFKDVTFFCLFISNSSYNIITRNYFSDDFIPNLGAGLSLANSNYNTISRNIFHNAMGNIYLSNSSDNNIKYNNFHFEKRIVNIFSTESVNNWQGNFWNRPRLLPFFIWNINPPRIIPSFDIDRRPALTPNNFYHINENKMTQNVDILELKILRKNIYWDMFPILQRILNYIL